MASYNEKDMLTLYRNHFGSYIAFVFNVLFPGKRYLHNWHLDVIADHLSRCATGEIKRLIINMPPRMMKSTCSSIALGTWLLGRDPSTQIMNISYGQELVKDFGSASQKLMQSPRYRKLFPNTRLTPNRCTAEGLFLPQGGYRLGLSAGGAITGRGADFIIIDDPLKASDAHGKELYSINQWFDDNIYQRLNNKNTGVIIVVMQRLHEDDLTGYLMSKDEDWTLLTLPAIAEENLEYQLSDGGVYLRNRGDVLHPEIESLAHLLNFKTSHGSYVFDAQYQQHPSSPEEGLVKADWFVRVPPSEWPTTFEHVFQSWDTAHDINEHNDYSVGITFGCHNKITYVLDVFRKKLQFNDLMKAIVQKRDTYKPRDVVIEDAASGKSLIQALHSDRIPARSYKPTGDKFIRLSSVAGLVESGLVRLPTSAPWLDDFVMELTRFPNARHDDQVDAFSQGLLWLQDKGRRRGFFSPNTPPLRLPPRDPNAWPRY